MTTRYLTKNSYSMKYWVESQPKKGFRFVQQTSNPKKLGVWNKPKKSTYALLGMGLYLDEENHVQQFPLGVYSTHLEVSQYISNWGCSPELYLWCQKKVEFYSGLVSGKIRMVSIVNGVEQPPLPPSVTDQVELEGWTQALELTRVNY
jgi:hypothetical protein